MICKSKWKNSQKAHQLISRLSVGLEVGTRTFCPSSTFGLIVLLIKSRVRIYVSLALRKILFFTKDKLVRFVTISK